MTSNTAVLFHRFGPYHCARLRAASQRMPILAIELSGVTRDYAWDKVEDDCGGQRLTLFPGDDSRSVPVAELTARLSQTLSAHAPGVVAIPGWFDRGALAAMRWCCQAGVPLIVMSDSTVADAPRHWWREVIKRQLLRLASAALAAGTAQVRYLVQLGVPKDRIFTGYDAVDNGYFWSGAKAARQNAHELRQQLKLPASYFLASARFLERKNLCRLLMAFARYRRLASPGATASDQNKISKWDLVMLGDGPLKDDLHALVRELDLVDSVHFPGFIQYPALPRYYGLAEVFIHPSTTEQWGLVVNEAMACGLPVLISERCGCAPDLVERGVNGFAFDPYDVEQLAALMLRISMLPDEERARLGNASRSLVADWGLDRFVAGLEQAATKARELGPRRGTVAGRLALRAMLRR